MFWFRGESGRHRRRLGAAMAQRAAVVLSDQEREVLERWSRRPKSAQALALRCRIVLAAADGEPSNEIAVRLGCSRQTVGRLARPVRQAWAGWAACQAASGQTPFDKRRGRRAGDRQDTGTTNPTPTSGTRPHTKSSTVSPTTVSESRLRSPAGCSRRLLVAARHSAPSSYRPRRAGPTCLRN
jgi:DNA-binding CsgD family transcriptional regulator